MIKVDTSSLQKYLCGIKIGAIFVIIAALFGESLLSYTVMLLVGLGYVFFEEKHTIEITKEELSIYKISGIFNEKQKVKNIRLKDISKMIIYDKIFHCLNKVVLEHNGSTCCIVRGYEIKKSDFQKIVEILKQYISFEVKL